MLRSSHTLPLRKKNNKTHVYKLSFFRTRIRGFFHFIKQFLYRIKTFDFAFVDVCVRFCFHFLPAFCPEPGLILINRLLRDQNNGTVQNIPLEIRFK